MYPAEAVFGECGQSQPPAVGRGQAGRNPGDAVSTAILLSASKTMARSPRRKYSSFLCLLSIEHGDGMNGCRRIQVSVATSGGGGALMLLPPKLERHSLGDCP